MNPNESTPQATIDRYIDENKPFAIIKKQKADEVFLLSGEATSLDLLKQIPRVDSRTPGNFSYDSLSIIPFAQARECGMEVGNDQTLIRCMHVREQTRLPLVQLLDALPQEELSFVEFPALEKIRNEFPSIVRRVIKEQIHKGNACNVVISTKISGEIAEMSPKKALTVFNNLLRREFGSYMTFFYYDGFGYHIGASPERHMTVDHGEVMMNPISGTYPKVHFLINPESFKKFLQDPKEINELFMCVDEEIKQMAQMCEEGGKIVGPLLKEMSNIVHTEYLLVGNSKKDCIDLLRASMHAPTVTGSPIESAFRIINETEKQPRGFYAGELVLLGHHADGTEFLDSAITIRTVQILRNGLVSMRVGASIVRDSDPDSETKEIIMKAGGVTMAVIGSLEHNSHEQLPSVMDTQMNNLLQQRNETLNTFLLDNQQGVDRRVEELKDKKVTIIDFEDKFSYVLKHMISAMGGLATVKRFDDFDVEADTADIIIVGPGPGDPRDLSSQKMRILDDVTKNLLMKQRRFLSVCLGHQKLCELLGLTIIQKRQPTQGMQQQIDFFGEDQKLGFYNTFAAVHDNYINADVSSDRETKEVHALRGKNYSSFQFHAESIFSQNGFKILAEELKRLVASDS